jgi:signal transduction histidine kinase
MELVKTQNSYKEQPEIKILVVDDREDNLFSIETILDKDGYSIIKANSGRAALKILLKEHDFTLILMDVQMPDLNGFETASLIYERDRLKNIPIIFITANDYGEENIFKGYQLGGVDYIYKPINPELLKAKVAVFVELYHKNHELRQQEQRLTITNANLEKEIYERKNSERMVKDLNKQLIENIQQLKASNEELERFAYVASHDLQEPLRKIIVFGGRLSSEYSNFLDSEGRSFLQRMLKASERMQMLIRNLLAFSRSSTSSEALEEVDLNALVTTVLSDLEVIIEQKKAQVTVGPLPVVSAVPAQFRQVFQNLIINSLKFSKSDAVPEIEIFSDQIKGIDIPGLNKDKYSEDFCRIFIRDNGIGFDMQYSSQIFLAFKRLHTYDQFEGTGIGLSICKKIIERHNGFITADSEEQKGSTFIITLPVRQHAIATVSL